MRKFMVAYGIWDKEDMMEHLLSGLKEHAPGDAVLEFYFDACSDRSVERFIEARDRIMEGRPVEMLQGADEIEELSIHNLFMHRLMESDCEALLILQDDMRLTRNVCADANAVMDALGDAVGYMGGRDGYEACYNDAVQSVWSESVLTEVRAQPGEWVIKPFLNIGPMVYPKAVVAKAGFHDTRYRYLWWYDDYCAKSLEAGFSNVLLGTGVEHRKFGKISSTCHYDDSRDSAHDRSLLTRNWSKYGW